MAQLTCADLSGRNVAFTSKGLSELTEEELFELIGPPKTEELRRRDGKPLDTGLPRQLVMATSWASWIEEDEEDIRILDFGVAFPNGMEPKKLPQPTNLKAPETIFEDRCDSRLDLWRAGIIVRPHRGLGCLRRTRLTSIYLDRYIHYYSDIFPSPTGMTTGSSGVWSTSWRIYR